MLTLVTIYAALGFGGVTHQSRNQVEQIIGFIGIATSVLLYASPLETIRRVLATKSAASIPIWLCVAGTVSNALWTVYAVTISDFFFLVPNAICLAFAGFQMLLYTVFNPSRQKSTPEDEMENGDAAKPSSARSSPTTSSSDSASTSKFDRLESSINSDQ